MGQSGSSALPKYGRSAVLRRPNLNLERTAEPPAAIVRLRAVVAHEDAAVAAITIKRAAEFPDVSRCCNPARRLRIELFQLLQFEILFFRQKLDAHGRGHVHGGTFRFVFLPRIQRFTVVAKTGAAFGTLR